MAKKREWLQHMQGSRLLARGDVIQVMEKGELLHCRVLSCLSGEDGSLYASLEITEGERTGERFQTTLKVHKQKEDP